VKQVQHSQKGRVAATDCLNAVTSGSVEYVADTGNVFHLCSGPVVPQCMKIGCNVYIDVNMLTNGCRVDV
jgi:hypothetical protein